MITISKTDTTSQGNYIGYDIIIHGDKIEIFSIANYEGSIHAEDLTNDPISNISKLLKVRSEDIELYKQSNPAPSVVTPTTKAVADTLNQ